MRMKNCKRIRHFILSDNKFKKIVSDCFDRLSFGFTKAFYSFRSQKILYFWHESPKLLSHRVNADLKIIFLSFSFSLSFIDIDDNNRSFTSYLELFFSISLFVHVNLTCSFHLFAAVTKLHTFTHHSIWYLYFLLFLSH